MQASPEISHPGSGRVVELELIMERLVGTTTKREEYGVTFVGMRLSVRSDFVVTDKLMVTDEAVKCLDVRT